ncbi:MAG: DEAD/DEAH box helicase [Clostridia bacterium]
MKNNFNVPSLSETLIKALEKQNISIPTQVQSIVIPIALEKKDIIVQSETGTGKTLAYLLPVFQNLDILKKELQVLILVPTHELAIQIQRQIELLSQNSDIKAVSTPIIGNVNIERQIMKLREKPQIIVGTAGRILELIKKKKITAHTIKTIVLDEADKLTDENNIEIIKAVIKTTLRERQIMAFSASILRNAEAQLKSLMKDAEIIKPTEEISIPDTIEHIYIICEKRDKIEVVRKLARIIMPKKAIIFIDKTSEIEKAIAKLKFHKLNAESIHGANRKADRKMIIENFKSGKVELLVASDLAARGLDIQGITHIFNLDLPEEPKDYLHRVGRCGRNGNQGFAISIVTEKELRILKLYQKSMGIEFKQIDMSNGEIKEKKINSI